SSLNAPTASAIYALSLHDALPILELARVLHFLLELLGDAGVAGQNHPHVTVELYQLTGQGVHHAAQTASLDKGVTFRADEGNASPGQVGHLIHRFDLLHNR